MKLVNKAITMLLVCCMLLSPGMDVFAHEQLGELDTYQEDEITENEELELDLEEENIKQQGEMLSQQSQQNQTVLQYILPEHSYLETPDIQNIAIIFEEGTTNLSNAILYYTNKTTNQTGISHASQYIDDAILFAIDYNSSDLAGIYELDSLTIHRNGMEETIIFSEIDMQVQYGVNTQVEVTPDAYLMEEDSSAQVEENVVVFDEDGNTTSVPSIGDAITSAQSVALSRTGKANGEIVVVLDPGHDSTHTGAQYHGLSEEDVTLKIAKYCKQELETYKNVKVIMTRTTQACANKGGTLSACLDKRVATAKAANADVLVSLHLNASTSSTAKGVGVYCPNNNWKGDIGKNGQALGSTIAKKLMELGIPQWSGASNGVVLWNSSSDTYPDGSVADYLGIVNRSKRAGFPGIIVEHAFLSNSDDVSKYLNSDAKLKKLGVADAKGIAEFFNLSKQGATVSATSISSFKLMSLTSAQLNWKKVSGVSGYRIYRKTGKGGTYQMIKNITSASTTSYLDNTLIPNQTYYYKMRAYTTVNGVDNNSSYTQEFNTSTALKNVTLKSVKIDKYSSSTITWNKTGGVTGYRVYRRDGSGSFKLIKTLKGSALTSYVDKEIVPNKTYTYRVRAYKQVGGKNYYSPYSKQIKVSNAMKKVNLTSVKIVKYSSNVLTWKKTGGITGYCVYRKEGTGSFKLIKTINGSGTLKYTDKAIKPNKTYTYRVRGYKVRKGKNYYAPYSNNIKVNVTLKPTNVKNVKKTKSSVQLSLSKVGGVTGYRVYKKTSNGKYQLVKVLKGSGNLVFTDKNLKGEIVYRVRAFKTSGKKNYYSSYSKSMKFAF